MKYHFKSTGSNYTLENKINCAEKLQCKHSYTTYQGCGIIIMLELFLASKINGQEKLLDQYILIESHIIIEQ